jgi:hypothetical protein
MFARAVTPLVRFSSWRPSPIQGRNARLERSQEAGALRAWRRADIDFHRFSISFHVKGLRLSMHFLLPETMQIVRRCSYFDDLGTTHWIQSFPVTCVCVCNAPG